jgi:hypothetical protein
MASRGALARVTLAEARNLVEAWNAKLLTALLVYGYPVLALTLLLGAIELPLPDGLAMTVAGLSGSLLNPSRASLADAL